MPFDSNFANQHEDVEMLVALHSSAFKQLYNWDNSKTPNEFETIVCIRAKERKNSKKVYRKAIGHAFNGLNGDNVMVGYRTRRLLNVKENDEVIITRGCWFMYLLNHLNSAIRGPFIIAIIFGIITLISFILSIIPLLHCCCN